LPKDKRRRLYQFGGPAAELQAATGQQWQGLADNKLRQAVSDIQQLFVLAVALWFASGKVSYGNGDLVSRLMQAALGGLAGLRFPAEIRDVLDILKAPRALPIKALCPNPEC
jgi:hypothetical protein